MIQLLSRWRIFSHLSAGDTLCLKSWHVCCWDLVSVLSTMCVYFQLRSFMTPWQKGVANDGKCKFAKFGHHSVCDVSPMDPHRQR